MASAISPRSPLLNAALNSPIEFLPVTRFPVDDKIDSFQKLAVEKEKEREVIQAQPYRTTQLIYPGPKPKPDMVDNKLAKKPTIFRPLDHVNVVGNLNTNQAVVHRQFNSPRPLYSQQNVAEAVYVQTGYNVGQQPQAKPLQVQQQQQLPRQQPRQQPQQQQRRPAPAPQPRPMPQAQNIPPPASPRALALTGGPIHLTPDKLPDFNPQKSPTFRAIIEMEGLGTLQPAPNTQTQQQQQRVPHQPAHTQRFAHSTAPTAHLNSVNSVGMPNDRIAQSHSFKRLMYNVMSEQY